MGNRRRYLLFWTFLAMATAASIVVRADTLPGPLLVLTRKGALGYTDSTGTNFNRLPITGYVLHFAVAPTMDRLLYVTGEDGPDAGHESYYDMHFELFVCDMDGGGAKRITDRLGDPNVTFSQSIQELAHPMFNECGGSCYPHWSGDGQRILFMGWRDKRPDKSGSVPVFVANAADGTVTEIARIPGPTPVIGAPNKPLPELMTGSPLATYWLQQFPFLASSGASPELNLPLPGTRRARTAAPVVTTDPATGLPVFGPGGQTPAAAGGGETNAWIWYTSNLRWHPDGETLTWSGNTQATNRFLWVRPLAEFTGGASAGTNRPTQLQYGDEFLWSPNGQQAALIYRYGDDKGTGNQVLLADRVRGRVRQLHNQAPLPRPQEVRLMCWSADSAKLAVYVSGANPIPPRYLLFDVAGTNTAPVEVPGVHITDPQTLVCRRLAAFGPDNRTFYFVGFPIGGHQARSPALVAVPWPTNAVSVVNTQTLARLPVLPADQSVDAFAFVTPKAQWCAPLDLVVPASAGDWVARDPTLDEPTRNRLRDGVLRLPDLQAQYQQANAELEAIRKKLRAGADEPAAKDQERLAKRLREIETDYLRAISPVLGAFTDAEEDRLAHGFRDRCECLAQRTAEALDAARAVNYTTSWSEFNQRKRLYDLQLADLTHALNGFQTLNSLRLFRGQRRLSEARSPFARDGRLDTAEAATALRPLQRRLRDVYLDMGWAGYQGGAAQSEAGLLEQDSYLAGVWAVTHQAQSIELGSNLRQQSAQAMTFSLKYLLAGGSAGMGGAVDGAKRLINLPAEALTGGGLFDTTSSEVTTRLKETREKNHLALATLDRIRGYSDDQTAALLTRVVGDVGLTYLSENRIYHEQTSGGLRRLTTCYLTDIDRLMDEELRMAGEHAALTAADMEKAFNAKVGANPQGEFERWKRVFTDPLGVARVAIQNSDWGGDHYSAPLEHAAKRKAQAQEIESVRQAMGQVGFDPEVLRQKLPHSCALYLELEHDNPDFLQWTLTRERLAAQRRIDELDHEIALAETPAWAAALQRKKLFNRALLTSEVAWKQSWLWQLQGADKLMVWDYDGAVECFYQAGEAIAADRDRRGEADRLRANVEELRQAVNWQKSVEAGMETAQQLGNMGVQAAYFEALGQTIGWGVGGPAARTARPAPASSVWLRDLPASGFADFVWRQANPFADLLSAAVVKREWEEIGKAAAGLGVNVGLQVAQQDIVKKGILKGYFGMDEQWADFLANALATVPQTRLASGNTLFYDTAAWLRDVNAKFDFQVDFGLWQERQQARASVSDFHYFYELVRQFCDARAKLDPTKLTGASPEEVKAAAADAGAAKRSAEQAAQALTRDRLAQRYAEMFPADGPPPGSPERLKRIGEFFQSLKWKAELMELKLKKGDRLNRQIDDLRRELIATAQFEFFEREEFKKYRPYVVDYLYIGSAGKKDAKAYKLVSSDIDFTLLVNEDTPESVRNELREDFLRFFQGFAAGKELEGFEMSLMVDPMPRFFKNGETVGGLVDMIWVEPNAEQRAKNRGELKTGIEKTLEQLVRNASDKERYLDRGNLFRHNLFIRLGCFLKKVSKRVTAEGVELEDESPDVYDRLYGEVPLEAGMAFDCVAGNLGYVFQHALDHPADAIHYQKQLGGKYAIRGALYSLLLLSPEGRAELQKLTRATVEANGWEGAERVVVETAKKIIAGPDGLKKLGLPTTLTVPGQREPIVMDAKAWIRLFDEWNARKEGQPEAEIFAARHGGQLSAMDPALNDHIARNIVETEACFKVALRKSIMDRSADLLKLRAAHKNALAAGETEAAGIFELKMKEVVLSLAAVWNRLSREQQNLILRELPPEADWLLAINAAERLDATAAKPAPTSDNPDRIVVDEAAARDLQPRAFVDESAESISRRIGDLKARAFAAKRSRWFGASPMYDAETPPTPFSIPSVPGAPSPTNAPPASVLPTPPPGPSPGTAAP